MEGEDPTSAVLGRSPLMGSSVYGYYVENVLGRGLFVEGNILGDERNIREPLGF